MTPLEQYRFLGASLDPGDNAEALSALLDQVLTAVQTSCQQDGLQTHWKIFEDRVVQPILQGSEPPSLSDVCRKHDIKDEKKASNMLVTVKRRFRSILRRRLRNLVRSDSEAEAEFREIFGFLSGSSADF